MTRPDFTSPRLYMDARLEAQATVPLERDQAHYLLHVLRLPENASILVFNGVAGEWRATLRPTGKRGADLAISEQTRPQSPPSRLTYGFAPLKHARLDYMVQKAVEMGAGVLQPVLTRRTQVARVNLDRMRANAVEAAEQCGVLALPAIDAERRFDAWLAAVPTDSTLVFCDEDAPVADPIAALRSVADTGAAVSLVVGPEGGFDETERAALLSHPGSLRVSLGPRILRADTAAVAALAVVQAVLGDWR